MSEFAVGLFTDEELVKYQKLCAEIEATERELGGWDSGRRPQNEAEGELFLNHYGIVKVLRAERTWLTLTALRRSPLWKTYAQLKAERSRK